MTRKEFEAIVDDAVENGADREEAEAYVRAGFKVDEEAEGAESLGMVVSPKKRTPPKKKAK